MGLILDTARAWLAPTRAGRRAGVAGLLGHVLGAAPRVLRSTGDPWTLVHYPRAGARRWALTTTLGLGDTEVFCLSLGDAAEGTDFGPGRVVDVAARHVDDAPTVAALPEGCLGLSAHHHVALGHPPHDLAGQLADWERAVGRSLCFALAITDTERAWVARHGLAALLEEMDRQEVPPCSDRRAGDTWLRG